MGKKIVFLLTTLVFLTATPFQTSAQETSQPVTLQKSIESTLKNHSALKIIQENRQVVIHELRRAKAGWGPRVDITGRTGANQLSDSTTRSYGSETGMYGNSAVGLLLVQPLWDGFATRSRVRAAEATVDSMSSRVLDNANTLALDGVIAHIDLLRRREIYRLAEENVRRHREILESSKDRQQQGTDTMADVTQTQGRLSRALSTLSESKASLLEGESSYRRITGQPVPKALETVALPVSMFEQAEAVLDVAKQNNPKLKAYLSDIKAAADQKDLAKSTYHPVINLEAGPNYSDRMGPGSSWTHSFDVMGVMRWNLFNSGADQAEVKAANSRMLQSRQVLFNYMDDLTLEVQDTWTRYMAAQEQKEHYEQAIEFNTQTRDMYLEQFLMGQRSLLDVLDAESELFNSSTQAETARGNILVGGFRMYGLAGTLLPDLGIDTKNLYMYPETQGNGS